MRYNGDLFHRTSNRRLGHDYHRDCMYFITIKTHECANLFGSVLRDAIHMKPASRILWQEWTDLQERFKVVNTSAFVAMPDHVHGIITIQDGDETGVGQVSLARAMQAYKSLTTRRYSHGVREHGWEPFNGKVWQRSYHDRIIRTPAEIAVYERYIADNPRRRWEREFQPAEVAHEADSPK